MRGEGREGQSPEVRRAIGFSRAVAGVREFRNPPVPAFARAEVAVASAAQNLRNLGLDQDALRDIERSGDTTARYELPQIAVTFTASGGNWVYDTLYVVITDGGTSTLHSVVVENPAVTLVDGGSITYRVVLNTDD